jgi:predicted transcriptional regulator
VIAKIKTPKVADIIKTKGVFRYLDSQRLSQVLSDLDSSHDAAFVFNKNKKFLGVISPVYLSKTRSINTKAKLKTCLKMPPKVRTFDTLKKLAKAMLNSNIYFLPVINEGNQFVGIATVNRLFEFLLKNPNYLNSGHIIFSNRRLITINDKSTVSQVLNLMKNRKIAKIPVVNQNNMMVGLVSQYDLQEFIKTPFSAGSYDRRGEKQRQVDEPVNRYMKKMVITVNHIPKFVEAVNLMNQHQVGSLIIIDKNNSPMGIVTKKDLLQTVTQLAKL